MTSEQQLRQRFADKQRWNLILPRHQYDWLQAKCCPAKPTRIQVLRSLIQAAIDAEATAIDAEATGNR